MKSDNRVLFAGDRFRRQGCTHRRFVIDESKTTVQCRDCHQELNPMWLLARLADREDRLRQELDSLVAQQVALKEQDMNALAREQNDAYKKLKTVPERAQFLLDAGLYPISDIENLEAVYRPCAAGVMLPIAADSPEEAIEQGVAWLKAKRDAVESYESAPAAEEVS